MKHISLSKKTPILLVAAIILLFTSCQSVPTDVPENLTKADLIQLAQDSYDAGNTAASKYYYELIVERFPNDPSAYIVAKFEIAHLYVKDRDYKSARPLLEEIVSFYDNPEIAAILPEYLKLTRLDLAKCE